MSDRRSLLMGLITLPLIGGGVTLIGRPAAPVPLIKAVAMPTLQTPQERARYAWEAFAAAMREITAGSHAWRVVGGEIVTSVGYMKAQPSWCRPFSVNHEPMYPDRPEHFGLVDRHEEFDL